MNHLTDELRRFVAEQVSTGRFASEQAVLADLLERLRTDERQARRHPSPEDIPFWGLFQSEPELIDRVCAAAMSARVDGPQRAHPEHHRAVRGE